MFLWLPLTGTNLSPVAPQNCILPSGHTPGNRHDRRTKPGEGLRCCVSLQTRRPCLADRKIRGRSTQLNNSTPRPHPPRHTLQAARGSNRPERRMALVTWELARYMVDIAALSETRFSEQGPVDEVGAGYTFFWSGRLKAERRDAGVALAIRNDIVGRLPCLPQGINDRLMSLHLPLRED
ncbi:unnamed protein product, partial [Schistocephalus solidus]|uniref:Uncharacterized protein n=1 Tax=Schistocephalus solidus TaxID=70667 RepID=A0A183SP34_SCHSO